MTPPAPHHAGALTEAHTIAETFDLFEIIMQNWRIPVIEDPAIEAAAGAFYR